MEKSDIINHGQLLARIQILKAEKKNQEIELKNSFKDCINTFNPIQMIKNSLTELTHDKEVKLDLTKIGLNVGSNLIIDKVFGRNKSIIGFLSSMLLEKLSAKFINNNTSGIVSSVQKLFSKKSD